MSNKITKVINLEDQKLTVVGTGLIQVQIEHDENDAYIDLDVIEAKQLAKALLEHCES